MSEPGIALANGDSHGYWQAAKAGRLVFKTCCACGLVQFPPRHICPECWSDELEWREHAGNGRIHSFTVVHRAPLPDFEVPYVLALVELREGPRVMTNIVGPDALQAGVGDAVEVVFEERNGVTMPMFRRSTIDGKAST